MDKEIIISNKEHFEVMRDAFQKDGPQNLHVLADFDGTCTDAFVDGNPTPSLISVLRDGDYLTPDYRDKAKALYKKYSAIEDDKTIPFADRWAAMNEWWTEHAKLLVASGLKKVISKRLPHRVR